MGSVTTVNTLPDAHDALGLELLPPGPGISVTTHRVVRVKERPVTTPRQETTSDSVRSDEEMVNHRKLSEVRYILSELNWWVDQLGKAQCQKDPEQVVTDLHRFRSALDKLSTEAETMPQVSASR
jgi:hypothetical protein